MKLGPVEAANVIRPRLMADMSSRANPEDQHAMNFAKAVASQCGLEATPENVQHIIILLREHNIEIPSGQEYPKWVTRKYDNTQHVANNEREAHDIENAEPPPPPPPQPVQVQQPVHNPDIDLKDKVPHLVPHDNTPEVMRHEQLARPEGEQPNDLSDHVPTTEIHHKTELERTTDREAAQDQHPTSDPDDDVVVVDENSGIHTDHDKGVFTHDDPDRDGVAGQDSDPTHDNDFVKEAARTGDLNPPHRHSDRTSTDEKEKGVKAEEVAGKPAPTAAADKAPNNRNKRPL